MVKHLSKKRLGALCAVAVALTGVLTHASETLPLQLQATLFKKIFAFSRTLPKERLQLAVVYSGAAKRESAEKVVATFNQLGLEANSVEAGALDGNGAKVAYFFPNVAPEIIRKHCVGRSVLSVAPDTQLAEQGNVAVGLGLATSGRPDIVMHLPRLKEEGHEFEANLLSLTRVIR